MDRADQQILSGAGATLTLSVRDQDGEAAEPTGTVTVGVTRADGTTVLAAGTATTTGGTGVRTVALTAAQNGQLDLLTATWTNGTTTWTTRIEVVGGYYASVAAIRGGDPALADTERHTRTQIIAARRIVEDEFEQVCGTAFVPRFAADRLSGSGSRTLKLPTTHLRRLRYVRVVDSGAALSVAELASVPANDSGVAVRSDSGAFVHGLLNLDVGWEHGHDRPPADIADAFLTRLRDVLNRTNRGISDRATTFTATEGGTYSLATPGQRGAITGIPDVDVVLNRYRMPGLA